MKLRKYKSVYGDTTRDEIDLECTPEERVMLREFLEHIGVNLCTCVSSLTSCTCYAINEYRTAVQGFGDERCKRFAAEHFERNKKL